MNMTLDGAPLSLRADLPPSLHLEDLPSHSGDHHVEATTGVNGVEGDVCGQGEVARA
jgi:hypothetical protein